MNKFFILIAFCLLTLSCSQRKYMTYEDYHKVFIGEKISDIQVQMGRPYEVKEHSPHTQEYIYIERIPLGEHREIFRRFVFTVEHDRVIDKKLVEEVTNPLQFIGY